MMLARPVAGRWSGRDRHRFRRHIGRPSALCCVLPEPRRRALSLNHLCGRPDVRRAARRRAPGSASRTRSAIFPGIVGPIVTGMIIDRAGYTSAFVLTAGDRRVRRHLVGAGGAENRASAAGLAALCFAPVNSNASFGRHLSPVFSPALTFSLGLQTRDDSKIHPEESTHLVQGRVLTHEHRFHPAGSRRTPPADQRHRRRRRRRQRHRQHDARRRPGRRLHRRQYRCPGAQRLARRSPDPARPQDHPGSWRRVAAGNRPRRGRRNDRRDRGRARRRAHVLHRRRHGRRHRHRRCAGHRQGRARQGHPDRRRRAPSRSRSKARAVAARPTAASTSFSSTSTR